MKGKVPVVVSKEREIVRTVGLEPTRKRKYVKKDTDYWESKRKKEKGNKKSAGMRENIEVRQEPGVVEENVLV